MCCVRNDSTGVNTAMNIEHRHEQKHIDSIDGVFVGVFTNETMFHIQRVSLKNENAKKTEPIQNTHK